MTIIRASKLAYLTLTLATLSQPAHALFGAYTPSLYVSTDLCVGCGPSPYYPGNQPFSDEVEFKAASDVLSHSSSTGAGQDFADSFAQATYGALHAYADASFTPGFPLVAGDSGVRYAKTSAAWIDFLQPSKQPIAKDLTYHYHLVADGNHTQGFVDATATISLRVSPTEVGESVDVQAASNGFDYGRNVDLEGSFTIPSAYATQEYQITAFLRTEAMVFDCLTCVAYAQVDYSNTMRMEIDSVTPGGNTIAASGYDLATPLPLPVPELPTSILMVWGVVCMGFAVRGRSAG